jgi:hypothetical protein
MDSVLMWSDELSGLDVSVVPSQQPRRQSRRKHVFHGSLAAYGADLLPCCLEQRASRVVIERLHEEFERGDVDLGVVEALLHGARQLAFDRNGKDVLATLVSVGSHLVLGQLVANLKGCFLTMALHSQGCRLLQKLVEMGDAMLLPNIAIELQGHVLDLIESQYGNHVIQRLVEHMRAVDIVFIANEVEPAALLLAQHPYGCRILQLLIERCGSDSMLRIMHTATAHCAKLCMDQYGNYVIQHVVEYGPTLLIQAVCDSVCRDIEDFCSHKYASNVVEKAARVPLCTDQLINACLGKSVHSTGAALDAIVCCRFGNFVVQRLLEVSSRQDLISSIRKLSPGLKRYGKHVQQALQRLDSK